jgi:hypothetical protein
MAQASFNKKTLFTRKLDLNLRKKLVMCHIWSTALCGAETLTIQNVDQKYLESFEMWYWRMTKKISRTKCVRNEEVLHTVQLEKNILHTIKRKLAALFPSVVKNIKRKLYCIKRCRPKTRRFHLIRGPLARFVR